MEDDEKKRIRLRVVGCGLKKDVEMFECDTVEKVAESCAAELGVGPHHIRLLFRGKILSGNLVHAGVKDRTKIMAMYTADYHQESYALKKLGEIRHKFEQSSAPHEEELTQLLCALDGVDGGDWIRAERKALINRIQEQA